MTRTNRQITLAARPQGTPKESDFRLTETPLPPVADGQFVVRTHYISVDPYMRGRMTDAKSYVPPIPVGGVIEGGAVGTVIESKSDRFREGDPVLGNWGWQEYAVLDGRSAERIDSSLAPISTALGVLGMPGMTAYFGLLEIGKPQAGETVFVSGAAGAVGSLVGQIAKLQGCRVAGSAGSDEKVEYLLKEAHFDAAFNYRGADLGAKLDAVCPQGIDVYFDNVGGPLTDAVFTRINLKARIAICGQIDQYNSPGAPMGPRILWHLIVKRARAEGFLVFEFAHRYAEGRRQIAEWIREGKITYRETMVDGIENTSKAFIGLFEGENTGKMLVRVVPE